MGLDNLLSDDTNKTKDYACPECGNVGEHRGGIEYKCTTDREKCKVITYYIFE